MTRYKVEIIVSDLDHPWVGDFASKKVAIESTANAKAIAEKLINKL